MKKYVIWLCIALAVSFGAYAATTITEITYAAVQQIILNWESNAQGSATATTTNYYTGKVIGAVSAPGVTTVPTDNFDVTVVDQHSGVDVLAGGLKDCSNTANEFVGEDSSGAVAAANLTFNVTNAGSANTGTITVWIR